MTERVAYLEACMERFQTLPVDVKLWHYQELTALEAAAVQFSRRMHHSGQVIRRLASVNGSDLDLVLICSPPLNSCLNLPRSTRLMAFKMAPRYRVAQISGSASKHKRPLGLMLNQRALNDTVNVSDCFLWQDVTFKS